MSGAGEVLVVDSDASIRSLLEIIVRMLPRRPVIAADGRSAVALLSTHSYDALILDLILPEVSGEDVLHFLGAHAPELLSRTIVVTTLPASQWSRLEETRSCAAILRKPFSLDELQTALRACCEPQPESRLHPM